MITEWIAKGKVSQVFNNNAQGSRLRGRSEKTRWSCVRILIEAKLKIGKRDQETELTGRSPLRRRGSALDCSAVEEKEEEICLVRHCSHLIIGSHTSMCCY